MLECQSCLKCPSSQPNLRLLRVRMLVFCLCLFLCVCICLQREEQLKEEARVEGQDTCARAKTVCYSCALGDFGHSYILSQHEESRSGVAHQGAEFVAPEVKDGRVSTMASDIFSAGKILEELLNLSESFGEAFEKEPKFMVRKLRGLANLMCSPSPSERPTALRSCQKLDTLGESIN